MAKHAKRHVQRVTEIAGIVIREIREGYWMADFQREGKRVRRCFSDLNVAKAWATAEARTIAKHGTAAAEGTADQRREFNACMGLLKGTSYTIRQCVEDFLRRHPSAGGQTVRETCDAYLKAMKDGGRRDLSIYEKTLKFALLCTAFGERLTVGLEEAEVEQWAKGRGTGAVTTQAHIGAAKDLLRFFQRGGKLHERTIRDEAPPATWDAATVAKLLRAAEHHAADVVAGLAILFFAGLRPHEMLRLTWEAIDLVSGVIRLTGELTKTRSGRNVLITTNLRKWLLAYRGTGLVVPSEARYRTAREKAMTAAKATSWPVDVARHTFATAHYNLHSNVGLTMKELGHRGTSAMFENHYRGVAMTTPEAAAYFEIEPMRKQPAIVFEAAG
jgi:integrase